MYRMTEADLAVALSLSNLSARRLVALRFWRSDHREDLAQEFMLSLVEAQAGFDPDRCAWKSFATRVIRKKLARMVEARWAARRTPHREAYSLDATFEDGDGDAVAGGQFRGSCDPEFERVALRLDVDSIVESLPSGPRILARTILGNAADPAEVYQLSPKLMKKKIREALHKSMLKMVL